MSEGMDARTNCHIRIPSVRNSIAMAPPPTLLKPVPKLVESPVTPQPALLSVVLTHEVVSCLPVSLRLTPILQPLDVCSVIWFAALLTTLTVSITSISPFRGQLEGSDNQSAGHVPQPIGVWTTSKMKRLPTLYCFLEEMRTEKRPVEAFGTVSSVTEVSTRRTAEDEDA